MYIFDKYTRIEVKGCIKNKKVEYIKCKNIEERKKQNAGIHDLFKINDSFLITARFGDKIEAIFPQDL